jgi:hypothetical protein
MGNPQGPGGKKGYLLPWLEDNHGLSADVYYGNQHLERDPEFAQEPA